VRHLSRLRYVTDPDTGRSYPVPAGGAADGDPGEGESPPAEGEGQAEAQPGDGQGDGEEGEQAGEGEGFKSPESKQAVLADLTSERERRRTAESELQRYREAEQAREREAMGEVDRARAEGRDEGVTLGQQMLRRAAAMVAAADPAHPFYDPSEAVALLGDQLAAVEVAENGTVDEQAVRELVAQLAEQRPHLVRTAGPGRQPAPADLNGGGGPGGVTPPAEPRDADEWNAQLRQQFQRT
jgi:hypothetical protein